MSDISEEIKEYENEKKVLENKTEYSKNVLVEDLLYNGVGKEIKNTLSNPYKVTKFKLFKIKLKKIIKDILEAL